MGSLSNSATEVASFVEDRAKHLTTGTIRRRIASISNLLKLNNYFDPIRSPEMIRALKLIHMQKCRTQNQAPLVTKDILEQLNVLTGQDLIGARDRVMLTRGNETMRRRSELCNFRL